MSGSGNRSQSGALRAQSAINLVKQGKLVEQDTLNDFLRPPMIFTRWHLAADLLPKLSAQRLR